MGPGGMPGGPPMMHGGPGMMMPQAMVGGFGGGPVAPAGVMTQQPPPQQPPPQLVPGGPGAPPAAMGGGGVVVPPPFPGGARVVRPPMGLKPPFPHAPPGPVLTRAFVGKLPTLLSSDILIVVLGTCGGVRDWQLVNDPLTGVSRGFGFVSYETADGLLRALRVLSGFPVMGQQLAIKVDPKTQAYLQRYNQNVKDATLAELPNQGRVPRKPKAAAAPTPAPADDADADAADGKGGEENDKGKGDDGADGDGDGDGNGAASGEKEAEQKKRATGEPSDKQEGGDDDEAMPEAAAAKTAEPEEYVPEDADESSDDSENEELTEEAQAKLAELQAEQQREDDRVAVRVFRMLDRHLNPTASAITDITVQGDTVRREQDAAELSRATEEAVRAELDRWYKSQAGLVEGRMVRDELEQQRRKLYQERYGASTAGRRAAAAAASAAAGSADGGAGSVNDASLSELERARLRYRAERKRQRETWARQAAVRRREKARRVDGDRRQCQRLLDELERRVADWLRLQEREEHRLKQELDDAERLDQLCDDEDARYDLRHNRRRQREREEEAADDERVHREQEAREAEERAEAERRAREEADRLAAQQAEAQRVKKTASAAAAALAASLGGGGGAAAADSDQQHQHHHHSHHHQQQQQQQQQQQHRPLFNAEPDEPAEAELYKRKKRALVKLDPIRGLAAGVAALAQAGADPVKLAKEVARSVPADRKQLFEAAVAWDALSASPAQPLETKFLPWLRTRVAALMGGDEEEMFVDFVADLLRSRASPADILEQVKPVLADDAEEFVVKLWRLVVFEGTMAQALSVAHAANAAAAAAAAAQ